MPPVRLDLKTVAAVVVSPLNPVPNKRSLPISDILLWTCSRKWYQVLHNLCDVSNRMIWEAREALTPAKLSNSFGIRASWRQFESDSMGSLIDCCFPIS